MTSTCLQNEVCALKSSKRHDLDGCHGASPPSAANVRSSSKIRVSLSCSPQQPFIQRDHLLKGHFSRSLLRAHCRGGHAVSNSDTSTAVLFQDMMQTPNDELVEYSALSSDHSAVLRCFYPSGQDGEWPVGQLPLPTARLTVTPSAAASSYQVWPKSKRSDALQVEEGIGSIPRTFTEDMQVSVKLCKKQAVQVDRLATAVVCRPIPQHACISPTPWFACSHLHKDRKEPLQAVANLGRDKHFISVQSNSSGGQAPTCHAGGFSKELDVGISGAPGLVERSSGSSRGIRFCPSNGKWGVGWLPSSPQLP